MENKKSLFIIICFAVIIIAIFFVQNYFKKEDFVQSVRCKEISQKYFSENFANDEICMSNPLFVYSRALNTCLLYVDQYCQDTQLSMSRESIVDTLKGSPILVYTEKSDVAGSNIMEGKKREFAKLRRDYFGF